MNTALMHTVCRAAYHTGLLRLAARIAEPAERPSRRGYFQILVYHRVAPDVDAFVTGTPLDVFARQIGYVAQRCRLLSLTDLMAAADCGQIPARAVAITFDDGYEDTYLHAYPVLRVHGAPATVFLTTGLMDTDGGMWNDRLGLAIRAARAPMLDGVPGCSPLPLTTVAAREYALARALRALKPYPPAVRDEITERIGTTLGGGSSVPPRMLRWQQVREMHAHGIDFGAHTVTHPILTTLSAAEVRREITASKAAVEQAINAPVRHFAYPNGMATDFDDLTKQIVKEAGFTSASSMLFGTNTATTDRYALRRGGPWETDLSVFATKLWWYRMQRQS
jgi:peptidoglycan/xylan/chitin deacetylase (PgdA/CDA1 family)